MGVRLTLPVPHYSAPSIYELSAEFFVLKGIKLLLLDLDNTLVSYETGQPPLKLRRWLDSMKKAGIEPFIFSNNRGGRPQSFSEQLGISFIGRAKKPNPRRLNEVLEQRGIPPECAAIVGDQIYTDIFCGRRAGILSIAVRPIAVGRNPFRILRYAAELPFRLASNGHKKGD